jgi:hypothetical protein
MNKIMNLADMVDTSDPQRRTYRQINAAKTHSIGIGALVEMDSGVRAFVVHLGRDCDQTPLYYLSIDEDDTEVKREGFRNPSWYGGVSEDYLVPVKES